MSTATPAAPALGLPEKAPADIIATLSTMFEGRPAGLTVLNSAHELVTFVVMALVIGLFSISGA